MQWYRVIKTIGGRRYLYDQKTYREGKQVRTLNRYVGPCNGSALPATLETKRLYHATNRTFSAFDPNANPKDFGTWFAFEKSDDMNGYLHLHERFLRPGTKLLTEEELDELMCTEASLADERPFPQFYLSLGYRGIEYSNGTIQLWVPNEDALIEEP